MDIFEPILAERNLELVEVECRREPHGQVVRVLVDREGGIDLDSISDVSRELSSHLDVIDLYDGAYTLEVSSPGINRPLRTPEQFRRYVGKKVRARTAEPLDGSRNFVGRLTMVEPEAITLELCDGVEMTIPLSRLERANYEHEFSAADFGRRDAGRAPGRSSGR